jgi:hypothetical protein
VLGYALKLRDNATGKEVYAGAFGRGKVRQACESQGWSFSWRFRPFVDYELESLWLIGASWLIECTPEPYANFENSGRLTIEATLRL